MAPRIGGGPGFAFVVAAGWVLAVATWLQLALGAWPATLGGLGRATLCAGGGLLALGLAGRAVPGGLRRVGARLLVSAALVFVLAELGLRAAGALLPPSPEWLPAASTVERQLAAFRFAPGEVRMRFPCNTQGFYDAEPPPPGTGWVACVGDSFVAGAVPQPVNFTTVAERAAGVAVQAFGVPGAGPREYLELLRRDVLPRGPGAVLLCLFVGNDVGDSRRANPWWFHEACDPRNVRLAYLPGRLLAGGRRGAPGRGRLEGDTIVLDTPQGELRGSVAQLREALPALMPWLFDPAIEVPTYSEAEFLRIESARVEQACRPGAAGWPPLLRLLDQLPAAAGGLPVAVLLLPDEFQVDDGLWQRLQAAARRPLPERDFPQRRLAEVLSARGVPCLDVLPALRAAASAGQRVYLRQDTHLNLRGNEVVGEELGAFLARWPPR